MDCSGYREIASADLDGQASPLEKRALGEHLAACDGCRSFVDRAMSLHRALRVAPSPAVPDQTDAILRSIAPRPRSLTADLARALVAALGMVRVAAAIALLAAAFRGDGGHATVELAAAELAVGTGLLLVALRPDLAAGLLPVLVVLAAALLAGGAGDVIAGRAPWHGELLHVIDAAAAVLVWRLSAGTRRRRGVALSL